jgi:hypothetical protein
VDSARINTHELSTAEQAAKKLDFDAPRLKAPFDLTAVTARLKACPDTNRDSFRKLGSRALPRH